MYLVKKVILVTLYCVLLSSALVIHADTGDAKPNSGAKNLKIYELSLEELTQITITTAGKRPEKVGDIPASVTIITRDDIAGFGYRSLTDILVNVTGFFNIDSYSEVSGNFGTRGMWSMRDHNSGFAILINGVSQARDDSRSTPMSKMALPVEAIERVEVIRGPLSTIYGNGASFGVINIVTTAVDRGASSRSLIGTSLGDAGTYQGVVGFHSAEGDTEVSSNVGYFRTDGIDTPISELISPSRLPDLNGYGIADPQSYSLAGLMEQEWFYSDVMARWGGWRFDASYKQSDIERFIILPPVENGSTIETKTTDLQLQYREDITSAINLKSSLAFSSYDRLQDFDFFYPGAIGFSTLGYESYHFESVLDIEKSASTAWVFGLDYELMKGFHELAHVPDVGFVNETVELDNRSRYSLFFQMTQELTPSLSLVAGYRNERIGHYDRRGISNGGTPEASTFGGPQGGQNTHAPRLAFLYKLGQGHQLKALHGVANNIANERFDEEIMRTSEVSYTFNRRDSHVNVSLFKNVWSDLVIDVFNVDDDGSVSNRTTQDGELSFTGLEWEFSQKLNSRFFIELGGGMAAPIRSCSAPYCGG